MGKSVGERGFKFEWERKVAACRLGAATKSVAAWMCHHANSDGTNSRPGIRLLAHETELGESTVRGCLKYLREIGLLVRVLEGSRAEGRNYVDVYELAIPDDIADRVDIIEKPAEEVRVPSRGGKANHVRWHENRDITDPKCSYCAEAAASLASPREDSQKASGGVREPALKVAGKGATPIRPPLERTPTTARTDRDHRSVEEYHQAVTTKHLQHHSDAAASGTRASSRAADSTSYRSFFDEQWRERVQPGEVLTAEDEDYLSYEIDHAYVIHVVGELDAAEESTVMGMLYNTHACTVANAILAERRRVA